MHRPSSTASPRSKETESRRSQQPDPTRTAVVEAAEEARLPEEAAAPKAGEAESESAAAVEVVAVEAASTSNGEDAVAAAGTVAVVGPVTS